MSYRIFQNRDGINISDDKNSYRLLIANIDLAGMGNVLFYTRAFQDKRLPEAEIPITGRDHKAYGVEINSNLQYAEVGIGLGGFIPELVKRFGSNLKNKPIAIDPVNYSVMKGLLNFALTRGDLSHEPTSRIESFIERTDIITDPSKVRLYNMRLSEALEKHPEIRNSADIVIDIAGPKIYCETELSEEDCPSRDLLNNLKSRVSSLEMQLQR